MRRFGSVACLVLAALPFCSFAHATVRDEPVKLRRVGVIPTLRPGESVRLSFELQAGREASVANLEVRSASLARTFERRATLVQVRPTEPIRLDLEVMAAEKMDPLVIRYEVDGVPSERSIDLTPLLASERARSRAMTRIDDPGVPPGARGVPRPRPNRPAPTGDDDPEALPMQPPSVQAGELPYDTVYVHGRLMYLRGNDNRQIGADRIWVRVMDEDHGPDQTLASGYCDNQGYFSFIVQWTGHNAFADGGSGPDLYVKFETQSPEVTVQSTVFEIDYSWTTPIQADWDFSSTDLAIGAWMPSDQSTHGALHLHTNIQHNWDWYWYQQSFSLATVDVQWPESGGDTYYVPSFEEIHVGTNHTWDDFAHAHEYGHHWMENYNPTAGPEYCNDSCDDGDDCTHCWWCPENNAVAFSEGWPDWIGYVQPDSYFGTYGVAGNAAKPEFVAACFETGLFEDPLLTEGFFATILTDAWDSNNETDPNGLGQIDALALGTEEIFEVTYLDQPQTPTQFFNAFRTRFPEHTVNLWKTARNNRLQLDTNLPTTPTNLTSTTHTPNTPSMLGQIVLQWTGSTDEWSGVEGYDLLIDRPTLPDTVYTLTASTIAGTGYLPPGTYNLGIRARDRAGRTSPYVMVGPYVLVAPDPQNMTFAQPAGWARPVVPRPTNDATVNSVPNPTSLTGDSPVTYLNAAYTNDGDTKPILIFSTNTFCIDATCGFAGSNGSPDPGEVQTRINRGPVQVRGGRHVIGMYIDVLHAWPEPNEFDNGWAHPWIFAPSTMASDTPYRRAAPPKTTDGWAFVRDGSPFFATCDGMRMNATHFWNATWVAADQDTADYDLKLHFTTSSVDTGFAAQRGFSSRGPGEVDLVVVNKRVLTQPSWDIGITSSLGDQATYVIRHTGAPSMNYGDSLVVSWADSNQILLREVQIPGTGQGTAVATGDPDEGPFWIAFLDRTFTSGGLSGGAITLVPSDSNGHARILFNATGSGFHAVLLVRDPKFGRAARSVVLEVEPTPSNPAMAGTVGWHASLVPRPAQDGTDLSVPQPDTLFGSSSSTYLNLRMINSSPVSSPFGIGYQARIDGAALFTSIMPALAPSQVFTHHGASPLVVSGGRHTLTVALDHTGVHDELDELDNIWGEQWVWSPFELFANTPFGWGPVAPRTAGWSEVRSGEELAFNRLGMRTPPMGPGPQWADVAMTPGAGSDLDLTLHVPGQGAKIGFDAPLAVSAWGPDQSDYLLYDTSGPQSPIYDVGVIHVEGTAPQGPTVELKRATAHAVGTIGPVSFSANHSVNLHEVSLTPGSYRVRLIVHSGNADLGVSAHAPTPAIQSKSDAIEAGWHNGAGQGEEFVFLAPDAGSYAFPVWKVARADLAQVVSYSLEITQTVVAADPQGPPASTRLHFAAPNPFGSSTTVAVDLATSGNVTLEVFDVAGARVATLAEGGWAAGRHRLRWDGRSGDGRTVPAGLYLVRLTTPGFSATKRVVRMR